MDYRVVEEHIRKRITDLPMFDEKTCVVSDIDTLLVNLQESDSRFGCMLDFAGWRADRNKPFGKVVGLWFIDAVFIVLLKDDHDIDADLRKLVNDIRENLLKPERVDGVTPAVFLNRIEIPVPAMIGADMPGYVFGVRFEIFDYDN